ncbi:hypothetical protein [Geobacter anodireducens]
MATVIEGHLAEIISCLALLASVSANVIAERARRSAARAETRNLALLRAEKRTEMLVEIELKNAAVGNVLLVIAKKLMLFQKHPRLIETYPHEYDRLKNNLRLMQELKDQEGYQREVAEQAALNDFGLHEKALADVRRLRVRLEDDAQKEEKELIDLLQKVEQGSA